MELSIVTTLYKSAPFIEEFYKRSAAAAQKITADYQIIFVNDGSPDDSLERAVALQQKDSRVIVVDLSRNFGHHRALMTGLAYAQGERVFILDADLEEEPEWMGLFNEVLRSKPCDVVYGVQSHRKGNLMERWSGDCFYRLFNFLSGTPIPANAVIARLMSRRYVTQLLKHAEREVFLPGLWQLNGFRQTPYPVVKLAKGSTTYSLGKKISLFVNAITSFSDKPLVYIFYMGGAISLLSLAYVVWLLYLKMSRGISLMGWPSLIVSVWLLGGLTILFIGILGIYLAKMYREIKHRPYTVVRDVFPDSQHPVNL